MRVNELVDGLIARDENCWREFLGKFGIIVRSVCNRAGLNYDEAEDIAQTVVVKLLENDSRLLRKLEITTEHRFYSWVKVIASHQLIDWIRRSDVRRGNEYKSGKSEWTRMFESSVEGRIEDRITIENAVKQLSGDDQVLFWLDFDGLQGREISELLGVRLNTIQVRLSRLRKRLARILKVE